jgi:VanZ family protein
MALVWVLSDQPDPNPAPEGWGAWTSSLAHVGVFGALALAWAWALPGRPLAVAVALAVAYGIVDELHQSTTPGRDATPVDVALDALGAVLVALPIARYRGRVTSKTSRPRTRSAV